MTAEALRAITATILVDGANAGWQFVEAFTEGTLHTAGGEGIVGLMYPPATRARLAEVKRSWDPRNLLNQNQNISAAV